MPSSRAEVITRRTYNRPLNEDGTIFETWPQTVERVIGHQRWLWERAKGSSLTAENEQELEELRGLMLARKATVSGRTLWLGGTEVSKQRESCQFNCSATKVETVNDAVDVIWLLMQGCGVGFLPSIGTLNGFTNPINDIVVINSVRDTKSNIDNNCETWNPESGDWIIAVGDSAEAWAKSFGKLLAGKYPAKRLIFDLSAIRPAGYRLKGYGWISSGDKTLSDALVGISKIMNERAGKLLTSINILDVVNFMGTVLSSRRSAEIAFHRYGDNEWEEFATAKNRYWETGNNQRRQSNNSLLFYEKPSKMELRGLFELMLESGGSEPGFINASAALKRAPWFKLLNPCAEILLGNKSFCNLVETDLAKFNGDYDGLKRALYVMARANYRQTCVNLRDGILQDTWHELNEYLRLTGVGLTGIVRWEHQNNGGMFKGLKLAAQAGANSMADELGLPRSKAVTTIKPSGTLSKIMDTSEGIHKPLGRYIFNNINFGKKDPIVESLSKAGYKVRENPEEDSYLVTFPVDWSDIEFTKKDVADGSVVDVNLESAITQLERYKLVMQNYVDHNCSITVSYDPTEIKDIVNWLDDNWDVFVGVSWMLRADPTTRAEELGYLYLPQEVVTKEEYDKYVAKLKPIEITNSFEEIDVEGCSGGSCPIR